MSSTEKNNVGGSVTLPTPPDERESAPTAQWTNRPPAVLCDFDETTAVENVAELLLRHFSRESAWHQLRRRFREKRISFKVYQETAFNDTGAGRDAMTALVKEKATLRPHFQQLWQHCQVRGIPLAIVSVGLDFYVEALLEREGLEDVPRYTASTTFTPDGIAFEYPNPWDGSGASPYDVCREWGNCKCSVLNKYRERGHSIVYVGDGRSDACPASIADFVLARGPLLELCGENWITHLEFQDFRDVIRGLEYWTARTQRAGMKADQARSTE